MPEQYRYPLGRVVQHDPRSRAFAIAEADPATLVSAKWTRYAPVFDQGNLGSCTGNACLGALGTGYLYERLNAAGKLPSYTQDMAVSIYSDATKIDEWPGEYPPEDTGSSGLAVAKVAKNRGWLSSYYHAFSFNAALTALQTGPVITGVNWYSSFFYPENNGQCWVRMNAYLAGGHEIVIDELDMENKRIWFTNSWGEGWGLRGRAWFSFDTFQRLLNEQGDVTQLFPVEAPTPPPTPEPDHDGCLASIIGPWATKVIGQRWRTKKDKAVAMAALSWIDAKGL